MGPLSTESINIGLNQKKWDASSLIWWKGQNEWVTIESWKNSLPEIVENMKNHTQQTVWYLEHEGSQIGPMNSPDLQKFITTHNIPPSCKVWAAGMSSWKNLFKLPELMDFIGVTRRKHMRAPIKGTVKLSILGDSFSFPLSTISLGGIGIQAAPGFRAGLPCEIIIQSPMLVETIRTKGKVAYSSKSSGTGIQFEPISATALSTIGGFVNQFGT